ncbi:MAG: biopolymer transporter ExbD [Puniceicoccaceae bacterium]|nr:MAG: biopolymer transporter ExbD [Puniceicoccaceae bacterium]
MARTFSRPRRLSALSEMNVTALIDLGFALLIIFMISTPLIQQEQILPINLPEATQAEAIPAEVRTVNVLVVPGGYLYDGDNVSRAELEARFERLAAQRDPPVVRIRADREINFQEVVTVLDLLKKHRLTRIHLETQPGG